MSDEYAVPAHAWVALVKEKAAHPAPSSLRSAALLNAEPIQYEKDGWGIFGTDEDGKNGRILTHIGCDCEFPYWFWGTFVWNSSEAHPDFVCTECQEPLPPETYKEFVKVYKFLNSMP